jgi:hypothetical protein
MGAPITSFFGSPKRNAKEEEKERKEKKHSVTNCATLLRLHHN